MKSFATLVLSFSVGLIPALLSPPVASASEPQTFNCRNKDDLRLSATLVDDPKWGWIANLFDGYDSTRNEYSNNQVIYGMRCSIRGSSMIRCFGQWNFMRSKVKIIEADFTQDYDGHLWVSFSRSPVMDFAPVILNCTEN